MDGSEGADCHPLPRQITLLYPPQSRMNSTLLREVMYSWLSPLKLGSEYSQSRHSGAKPPIRPAATSFYLVFESHISKPITISLSNIDIPKDYIWCLRGQQSPKGDRFVLRLKRSLPLETRRPLRAAGGIVVTGTDPGLVKCARKSRGPGNLA